MGWSTEYEGRYVLSNGDILDVTYITYEENATRYEPAQYEESDETYYINGEYCSFEELPHEVTPEIIEQVKASAVQLRSNPGRRLNFEL
ncbi:MAG: hypothetical protein DDT31_01675 [Syntrophomonadaceae bacterium]|nr:hypothetical protein [Bacillota bacterium]